MMVTWLQMSSEDEGSAGDSSSGEETEMRHLMQAQNRKKKKAGGFQAMGTETIYFYTCSLK
jgi:hypothetical protein